MTESNGIEHGQPGHACHMIDASDALAGIIIRQHDTEPGAVMVDSWANGMSKRGGAFILRQLAVDWDTEADAEDAEDFERARTAGLN